MIALGRIQDIPSVIDGADRTNKIAGARGPPTGKTCSLQQESEYIIHVQYCPSEE